MRNGKLILLLLICILLLSAKSGQITYGCTHGPFEFVMENDLLPSDMTFLLAGTAAEKDFSEHYVSYFDETEGSSGYRRYMDAKKNPDIGMRDSDINLAEWGDYLQADISKEELQRIVYNSAERLGKIYKKAQGRPLNKSEKSRIENTREYLAFAKECEPYAVPADEDWSDSYYHGFESEKERKPEEMQSLILKGLLNYHKIDEEFLKLRYGYQIVRLAHYAGLYEDSVNYYDRLISNLEVDSLYRYKALRYRAGALVEGGPAYSSHDNLTDYLLTMVRVAGHGQMLERAKEDFRLPGPEKWNETLKKAEKENLTAEIWLLRFLQNGSRLDLEPLRAYYRNDLGQEELEFMLVNYINTLEKEFLNGNYFCPQEEPEAEVKPYLRDLLDFTSSVEESRVRRPALWNLVAGYMHILLQEYEQAEERLSLAGEQVTEGDEMIAGQIKVMQAVAGLARNEEVSAELEGKIMEASRWLEGMEEEYNRPLVRRSLLLLAAQKYFGSGDLVKGYCMLAKTGYETYPREFAINYADSDLLEEIIAFLEKDDKSEYEEYISTDLSYPVACLYYENGNKYLYRGEFDQALKWMSKQGVEDYTNTVATSFEKTYYDSETGLYGERKFQEYSREEILEEVNHLLDKAEEAADPGKYYYRIASGLFHPPELKSGDRIITSPLYYKDGHPFYRKDIYEEVVVEDISDPTRELARQYYDKAMRRTDDRELAARSAFLAAAAQTEFSGFREYEAEKSREYYYDRLEEEYSDTEYYKEIIEECSTLEEYLED
ncbi:MAG: hypothetical protein ACOC5A_00920 [Halanaerobiales bacterium]